MTETVMITLIICLTVAFCTFMGACAAVSESKNRNKSGDGDDDFITRKEFEEYEHLVSDGLNDVLRELKNKVDK